MKCRAVAVVRMFRACNSDTVPVRASFGTRPPEAADRSAVLRARLQLPILAYGVVVGHAARRLAPTMSDSQLGHCCLRRPTPTRLPTTMPASGLERSARSL